MFTVTYTKEQLQEISLVLQIWQSRMVEGGDEPSELIKEVLRINREAYKAQKEEEDDNAQRITSNVR